MFKKLLIVIVVLILAGAFFLFKDYDSPELGQSLLDEVSAATGVELSATGFRFNLLEGIELDGVSAKSMSDGRDLEFTLDRLVFEHRLGPLLSGTVAVDNVVLEHPTFMLVESPSAAGEPKAGEAEPAAEPAESDAATEDGSGLALEIRQVVIEDGTLVVRNTDEGTETKIEGLDFRMEDLAFDPDQASLFALSANGELTIGQILLNELTLSDVSGRFKLADAVFELAELTFNTEYGAFAADTTVDFNPVPFAYTMKAEGNPLNVNGMMGATSGFGPGTLSLDVEGVGADPADVVAAGTLSLAEGEFPAVEMFTGIDNALGKKVVTGASYEPTSAQVRLEDNVLWLSPFRFETELARIDLQGSVNLAGPIALELALATPRDGLTIQGAGGPVLDVLADDEGWVPVPMTVSGTLEQAKVRPDAGALAAQARSGATREAKQAVSGAAENAIRGLFGRRKPK